MSHLSPGQKFKKALQSEKPLQLIGVMNACSALLAEQAGFRALYLSGAGISNGAFGLPDLGLTTLSEVTEEVRRITAVVDLPVLVDADTGFGSEINIKRAVQELTCAGAAGIHIEDQAWPKRCGHLPDKKLVSTEEMVARIKAAVEGKLDPDFVIMARTDAVDGEGIEAAVVRAKHYVEAGAEIIFAEAVTDLEQYKKFVQAVSVPVLANITEFGKTPLFSISELQSVGIELVLYPLSAFRAMNKAASIVYQTIRKEGTQKNVLVHMQTREELYELLKYQEYK